MILVASVVFEYKLRKRRTPDKGPGGTVQTKKGNKKEEETLASGKSMELAKIGNGKCKSGNAINGEKGSNSEHKSKQEPSTSAGVVDFIYGGPGNKIKAELPVSGNQAMHGKEVKCEDKHLETEPSTRQPNNQPKTTKSALKETNVDSGLTKKGKMFIHTIF